MQAQLQITLWTVLKFYQHHFTCQYVRVNQLYCQGCILRATGMGVSRFIGEWSEKKKGLWAKMPWWCHRFEEDDQTDSRWYKGNNNLKKKKKNSGYNQGMQKSTSECTRHWWATADQACCLSCQQRTENWGYNLSRVTKLHNTRLEKCCQICQVSISAAVFGW